MSKTVAKFEIPYVQILKPDGSINGKLPKFAHDNAELIRMYEMMTLVRLFDAKAVNLQRTGKLGTYASCLGHEAAHVGAGSAMKTEDCLVPMYREYGAQFWRGVKMEEVLLYWGGDERGNDFSGPAHDFSWCVPIATQCLHAAGAAMAFKLRKEPRVAVTFVGDGGTSAGDFYESINAAGAMHLPVVYMVVNNKWAISVPLALQTSAETLAQKAIAAGMPSVQVDGNDVIGVHQVVSVALDRARAGDGPTLIEAVTYRLSDHTTADDASRYRDDAEVEEAWKVEPLIRILSYLTKQGVWGDDKENELRQHCSAQIEAAVDAYQYTPRPSIESMFEYMYAELPQSLEEQRDTALTYATDEEGH
ncbi:MAG: pyruvate dehydrogenase (acetyl-transferring) E1 component subunit alpha [Gammaproteobacteria bacterium]